MDERRKFPRLAIDVNVSWKKVDNESAVAQDVTKNISEGGVCMMVYEPLRKGDAIELDFELPTSKVIHARGRVAWTDEFEIIGDKVREKYDVGVEFTDISEIDREEIKKFVFRLMGPA